MIYPRHIGIRDLKSRTSLNVEVLTWLQMKKPRSPFPSRTRVARLGLGKNASYEAARRGELPVLRFGRKLRVPIVAFERLLAEAKPSARTV